MSFKYLISITALILCLASCTNESRTLSFEEYKQKLRDSSISRDFEFVFRIKDSLLDTIHFECFIVNHSGLPVYLPYILDGSEEGWRYPLINENRFINDSAFDCNRGRCGNMNGLRKSDFKLLNHGDSISLLEELSWYHGIARRGNSSTCRPSGRYKVNLEYSTRCDSFAMWLGDGRWFYIGIDPRTMQKDTTGWAERYKEHWRQRKPEFDAIMDSMPRITLISDTVRFRIE